MSEQPPPTTQDDSTTTQPPTFTKRIPGLRPFRSDASFPTADDLIAYSTHIRHLQQTIQERTAKLSAMPLEEIPSALSKLDGSFEKYLPEYLRLQHISMGHLKDARKTSCAGIRVGRPVTWKGISQAREKLKTMYPAIMDDGTIRALFDFLSGKGSTITAGGTEVKLDAIPGFSEEWERLAETPATVEELEISDAIWNNSHRRVEAVCACGLHAGHSIDLEDPDLLPIPSFLKTAARCLSRYTTEGTWQKDVQPLRKEMELVLEEKFAAWQASQATEE